MAITLNNVENVKFLRNQNVNITRDAAIALLKEHKDEAADGTSLLARYLTEESGATVIKTIVGYVAVVGETHHLTIIDVEGTSEDVKKLREEINAKLGSGITSENTATAQLTALSGNAQSTSAETSVEGAKRYADAKILDLDYSGVITSTGVYVTNVTQADGIVSATTATLPTVQAISDAGKPITAVSESLGVISATAGTINAEYVNVTGNTFSSTTVQGALEEIDSEYKAAIDSLDYTDAAVTGSYVSKVDETNGVISVKRTELPSLTEVKETGKPIVAVSEDKGQLAASVGTINANYVDITDSGSLISATTVEGALAEIAAEIDAMDKSASAVDGQVVTTVSETDGKVSETKANVKDLQLGGYTKDTTATGDIGSTDTINAALSKLENKAAAITIANADKSINVTTGVSGTDINVNIKSGEKVLAKTGDAGIYTNLDLIKVTTGLPETVKERYQLLATDDSQIGANIDIPKDSHIVSITYITEGEHAQNLEYVYIDASGNTNTTYVDMSKLVLEAEFESGVTATDGVVHGVVDPTSESFLTVGANGFKLSGVQDAIDDAIDALNFTSDAAVAGQYVAAIEQTNGVVAVKTRANVSEAVLTNYTKGSDSGAVESTDTINEAISKLENQIDSKVDALDATVSGETADGKVNVKVTEANGVITAVNVVGTDIASASALTAEITARKAVDGQNGDTYAANTSANYISNATSLNDADVKLDGALKIADDAMLTGVAAGSGITVTTKENKSQTISAKVKNDGGIVNDATDGLHLGYIDAGVYDVE